jgi:hypothetical protein
MPPSSPPDQPSIRPAHPLAERLIARLSRRPAARVLELGAGSGRNTTALLRAGLNVTAITDAALATLDAGSLPPETVAALLSTHGFLHGTTLGVTARLTLCATRLEPGGLLYATFGSRRDARYGCGVRIDAATYAPDEGDERGVPHAFFSERELREALEARFTLEELVETGVDAIAGTWAHRESPLAGSVHWFAIGHLRHA